MTSIFEYENKIFKYDEKSIYSLIESIEKNEFMLPQFQREFVWSLKKAAALVDTILKRYPAGSLMFWRTEEVFAKRSIATGDTNSTSGNTPTSGYNYILDGQQRITTLHACIRGSKIEGKNFSKIYVNLDANDEDENIVISQAERDVKVEAGQDEKYFVSVHDLCNMSIIPEKTYDRETIEKIRSYQDALLKYHFPIIQLKGDVTINVATDIFERVNVQGESLGLFEIMVAKTYDEKKGFDLSEKYKTLATELKAKEYEIKEEVVLQVAAAILARGYGRKTILHLNKDEFIKRWDDICDAIKSAIYLFRLTYGIGCSRLLPYPNVIVPVAYFFGKKRKPNTKQKQSLAQFFWQSTLSGRYSVNTNYRVPHDIENIIEKIISGDEFVYNPSDWSIEISTESIKRRGSFNRNDAYIKALLCVYASEKPENFNDGEVVAIENHCLTKSKHRNYHHFFPSSFMEKNGQKDNPYVNHILNITLISAELNGTIRDDAPSVYMHDCQKNLADVKGKKIGEVMKTHLIGDGSDKSLSDWGVLGNGKLEKQFDTFIEKRAELLSKKIEALIK